MVGDVTGSCGVVCILSATRAGHVNKWSDIPSTSRLPQLELIKVEYPAPAFDAQRCIAGRSTARHDIVDTCELSTGGGVQFIQSPSQAGAPAAGLLSALSSASRSLHHMSSVERRVATANNSSASASSHMSHYEKIARQSGRRSTRGAPSLSGRKSLKDTPATIYSQGDRQSSGGGWGSGGGGGGGHHATTTQRGTRFGAGAVDRWGRVTAPESPDVCAQWQSPQQAPKLL
jgi:hypothetical protein